MRCDEVSVPSLDDLVFGPDGFTQLPLGTDPADEDPATSIVVREDLDCGGGTGPTGYTPVDDDRPRDFMGNLASFYVGVRDSAIWGIDVFSPRITTAVGIGPSSTRAELLAAYPGLDIVRSDERYDLYVVPSASNRLVFAVGRADYADVPENADLVVQMFARTGTAQTGSPAYEPIGDSCM